MNVTTLWYIIRILVLLIQIAGSKSITECTLNFDKPIQGQKKLQQTVKLLTITIELDNTTGLPNSVANDSDLFQPLLWKRVSGTHGKGLLQLKPIYEMLSLSLLGYETEESLIQLKLNPQGCMTNMTELEYEQLFRKFLLNFTKENDEVCNEHIENISGQAIFFHECCRYDFHRNMQCNRVLKNKWMMAIYYSSYIVIGIVLLYCPLLIPPSLYNPNLGPKPFVYCLKVPYIFNVKVTRAPTNYWSKICERFNETIDIENKHLSYSKMEEMTKFKKELETIQKEGIYQFKLTKVYLNPQTDEIIAENEVPVTIFRALREIFFGCGIENNEGKKSDIKNQEGVKGCCRANIFGECVSINYPWYKLLRFLLRFVLSVAVCLPWIIRICIFYVYEYDIRESRHKAAETRNLLVRIENNLTYYGTPVHILFILSYIFICFGYLCLELISVILFKNIKSLVRKILTEIFSGMINRSKGKVIRWALKVLLKPLTIYGMFGVIFAIPYWIIALPFTFIVSAYYLFPTVHIIVNFLCLFLKVLRTRNLNSDNILKRIVINNQHSSCFRDICSANGRNTTPDEEANLLPLATNNVNQTDTKPNLRLYEIGLMFILLCLILSSVLLTVEFMIFFIKVTTYTMVGLILNSSHAMQYISTISLAWLYYRRCFGGISEMYRCFNKVVQRILYKVNKKQVDEITNQENRLHNNRALIVINENANICNPHDQLKITERKIGTYDGVPKFKTNGVILLLDQFDKQYTTKQFFSKVCKNKPDGPGPFSEHFCIALRQFFVIFLFLLFVTLVVLAFGDSYSISFSNQLLATLAGGVVPWILMKTNILFSQADPPDVDEIVGRYFNEQTIIENSPVNNENQTRGLFKKKFNDEIGRDSKWWNISDMEVTRETKVDLLQLKQRELILIKMTEKLGKSE